MMGYADKAIKKWREQQETERKKQEMLKFFEEMMDTPEMQKARAIDHENLILQAMAKFMFNSLVYLEQKHRYKRQGLLNFINDFKEQLQEMDKRDDEEFYIASNQYCIDNYGIDVMAELELELRYTEKGKQVLEEYRMNRQKGADKNGTAKAV